MTKVGSAPATPKSSAVASPHAAATAAGESILRRGGNAIDAAIATAAALCVVYPNNVALGSDLVALLRHPDGSIECVNATGWAPRRQTLAALHDRHGDALPLRGVDTITVPGAIRGWESLHRAGGRLDWADLLAPAIELAHDGVPVSRSVAAAIRDERDDLLADPGCRALFFPAGEPLTEGTPLRQPALAETLQAIAIAGAAEFYTGGVAQRWLAGLRARGAVLDRDDLAEFTPEQATPLRAGLGEYTVITSPPNTQGFVLLRVLGQLAHHGPDPLGSGAGALAQAFVRANAVRDALLADPRYARVDVDTLVAADTAPAGAPPHGDTVGIAALSADGYALSLIQSVYFGFGACVLDPDTGILFQNRGTSFSLDPCSPNAFAPRKRPRHTLMPVLVTRGDELAWVSSTMGGQGQPQIQAQVLLRSFAGADPQQAVAAPRWIVGHQDTADTERTVTIESDLSAPARTALTDSGLEVKFVAPHSGLLGHANLIRVAADGTVTAGSDPRSDGSSATYQTPSNTPNLRGRSSIDPL